MALVLALFSGAAFAGSLTELSDADMGEVVAQDGIAVALELRVNADANGDPLSSLSFCSGLSNPCRMALNFNNRTDLGGEWLVLKDWYGVMKIDPIFLDAGTLANAGSNLALFDASKFADASGNCLVTGNAGACSTGDITSNPALVLSYPSTTLNYDPGTNTSSGYTSLEMKFTLGRMAVEFGANGYTSDNNGSFLGANVGDLDGGLAGASFSGQAYVFGF